jgi:hypothetical protein
MPDSFHVLHNWLFTVNQTFNIKTTNTKMYVSDKYPKVITVIRITVQVQDEGLLRHDAM